MPLKTDRVSARLRGTAADVRLCGARRRPGEGGRVADIALTAEAVERMSAALEDYATEVREILGLIGTAASEVGYSPDRYRPAELVREEPLITSVRVDLDYARQTLAVRRSASEVTVEVTDPGLPVLAAAVRMHRDDLARRLAEKEADPLLPAAARQPYRDRLAEVTALLEGSAFVGVDVAPFRQEVLVRRRRKTEGVGT
jgi:hypothetical protein